MPENEPNLNERVRRKMARPARTQSVATRFTKDEELEVLEATEQEGKTVREWTRNALLREARRPSDDPIFSEVVALRMLFNIALRPTEDGKAMTSEDFSKALQELRQKKQLAAREVMQQYESQGGP